MKILELKNKLRSILCVLAVSMIAISIAACGDEGGGGDGGNGGGGGGGGTQKQPLTEDQKLENIANDFAITTFDKTKPTAEKKENIATFFWKSSIISASKLSLLTDPSGADFANMTFANFKSNWVDKYKTHHDEAKKYYDEMKSALFTAKTSVTPVTTKDIDYTTVEFKDITEDDLCKSYVQFMKTAGFTFTNKSTNTPKVFTDMQKELGVEVKYEDIDNFGFAYIAELKASLTALETNIDDGTDFAGYAWDKMKAVAEARFEQTLDANVAFKNAWTAAAAGKKKATGVIEFYDLLKNANNAKEDLVQKMIDAKFKATTDTYDFNGKVIADLLAVKEATLVTYFKEYFSLKGTNQNNGEHSKEVKKLLEEYGYPDIKAKMTKTTYADILTEYTAQVAALQASYESRTQDESTLFDEAGIVDMKAIASDQNLFNKLYNTATANASTDGKNIFYSTANITKAKTVATPADNSTLLDISPFKAVSEIILKKSTASITDDQLKTVYTLLYKLFKIYLASTVADATEQEALIRSALGPILSSVHEDALTAGIGTSSDIISVFPKTLKAIRTDFTSEGKGDFDIPSTKADYESGVFHLTDGKVVLANANQITYLKS